jgi:ribosomal protein L20
MGLCRGFWGIYRRVQFRARKMLAAIAMAEPAAFAAFVEKAKAA